MNGQKFVFKKEWHLFLILLVLAALVRFWPDFKGGYWPIGYDTLNSYIPELLKFNGNFLSWLFSANLLFYLIWPFYKLFSIDPNYLMKVFGPLLYGIFTALFYV